jgi:hypothetical protein
VTFCDFDRDGYTDIFVANDTVRNFLYRNNGDGTFLDVTYRAGVGFDPNGKPQAGMGTDCADFDGDGFPDIFVANFSEELDSLYRNQGGGIFEDVSEKAGLGSSYLPLGFGTKMFDFDNDGDLDIYVTNGHVLDNVKLYVVISSVGQRPVLLRNQGVRAGNWILIRARGRKSNSFGLGATVRLETSEGVSAFTSAWAGQRQFNGSKSSGRAAYGRSSTTSRSIKS